MKKLSEETEIIDNIDRSNPSGIIIKESSSNNKIVLKKANLDEMDKEVEFTKAPENKVLCEYVSEEINGENISMSVFTKNSEITHIFFLDNNNIVSIAENTFDGLGTLIYFDFDKLNQLKRIESAAFRKTRLDPALGKEDTVIEYFGANLEFIGNFAFNQALTSSKSGKTLMIPPSVKTIESYGISNTDLPNYGWSI